MNDERIYLEIGRNIRSRREFLELTQDALAQRVGLTRTSITNIERGKQKIQIHTLFRIAEALESHVASFIPSTSEHFAISVDDRSLSTLHPSEREWVKQILTKVRG